MVIMPPGILRTGQEAKRFGNVIKLPVFMIFPQNNVLFKEEDDDLLQDLMKSKEEKLVAARREQRGFIREMARKHALTKSDYELHEKALQHFETAPVSNNPYMLISGRSITGQYLEVGGPIQPEPEEDQFSYLDYPRNKVEFEFVWKLLEEPHIPASHKRRPGSAHALDTFLELRRNPGESEPSLVLPNADTRQRMTERFLRSYILTSMDGELAKIPTILLNPNRYKRFDKGAKGGRV
jgi:hypothetical protein